MTKFMNEFAYNDTFNTVLFEDYFLNLIHGRGNSSTLDLSYTGNYEKQTETALRRVNLRRRSDALEYIEKTNPKFIIKHTEFQHLFDIAPSFWPGVRYVTVFRNGYDVVDSAVGRGWFTNDWCFNDMIEPKQSYEITDFDRDNLPEMRTIRGIPKYVDRDNCIDWYNWNPATRASYVWRTLNEIGIKYKNKYIDRVFQLRYEDFCKYPVRATKKLADWLGIELTDLTTKHIAETHEPPKHDFDINEIAEPERTKFINLNKRLGYKT